MSFILSPVANFHANLTKRNVNKTLIRYLVYKHEHQIDFHLQQWLFYTEIKKSNDPLRGNLQCTHHMRQSSDTTEGLTCEKTWRKWDGEGVYIQSPHAWSNPMAQGPFTQARVLLCLTRGSRPRYWAICSALCDEGPPPHALLVFYLPFHKGRGPANSHLHTSTERAKAALHSYVGIYHTEKKNNNKRVMVSV